MIADYFSDVQPPIQIHMKTGTPFEEILETAEKEAVDLIVMGSKGRSDFESTLFGSQAEKVFRHSKSQYLVSEVSFTRGNSRFGVSDIE